MNIRPYILTVIVAGLITILAGQRHSAVVLVLVIPILIAWVVVTGLLALRQAKLRSVLLRKILIWVIALLVIAGLHLHYIHAARAVANDFVAALEAHKAKTGAYPTTGDSLGIEAARLRSSKVIYKFDGQSPTLYYAATLTFRATYQFDFTTKSWIYSD